MLNSNLNSHTRVAVFCYESPGAYSTYDKRDGDEKQVIDLLDFFLHHECPVVTLSPEDAKVNIKHPDVENLYAGKRSQFGPDAHVRFLEGIKLLLSFPEDYFLIHDSDSLCLDPKIPDYLYVEPNTVWSNQTASSAKENKYFGTELCLPTYVADRNKHHEPTKLVIPQGLQFKTELSFQPPWFLSRKTIEAFIAASGRVNYNHLPWVEYYVVQLTQTAGLPWKAFHKRHIGPTSPQRDDPCDEVLLGIYRSGLANAIENARNGANMIHSVKNSDAARALKQAYLSRSNR
jgi:hypothetical protein